MNKIKKMLRMLMIIILILCGIIGFILTNKKEELTDNENNNYEESGDEASNQLLNPIGVESQNECFTIMECAKKYTNILVQLKNTNDLNKANLIDKLYNMTTKEYIAQYDITKENLMDNLMIPYLDGNIKLVYLSKVEGNVIRYYVNMNAEYDGREIQLDLTIFLDRQNKTFSVMQGDQKYNYEKTIYVDGKIEKNGDNQYADIEVTDEYICKYYFNDFVEKLQSNDLVEAYNVIDLDCRDDMFEDYSNFENYVLENKETIKNIKLITYKVEKLDNYTEYICKTSDGKVYTFIPQPGLLYVVYIDN